MTERSRPRRPASSRHELSLVGVRTRVRCRSSLFAAAGLLRAARCRRDRPRLPRALELVLQQHPQRRVSVETAANVRRNGVVGEAGLAILADEPAVLEQPEMARHTRLGNAENAGQLGHVQPLLAQQPEQPQPDVVAEQPIEGRRLNHIYKSTLMDINLASATVGVARA